MFFDTVTVYNKYKQNNEEKWKRTVISGVYWNEIKAAVMQKTGAKSTDKVNIIIPVKNAPKGYVKPLEFASADDKSNLWTLQSGDTIIKGNISYEVTRSSSELRQFDDMCVVTSADFYEYGQMAHWEVVAT